MTAVRTTDPHDPWLARAVRIRRIISETAGVATYDLEFEDPAVADGYVWRSGQFNMLYLPGAGEIAISISGDPAKREIIPHTIRNAGSVTGVLAHLPVGSTIGLRGPFGTGWPVIECQGRDVILVAGGIGLAPLRSVIYELLRHRERYGRLVLLFGARSPALLLFPGEYDDWRRRGLEIQLTVDRVDSEEQSAKGWQGNVGMVAALLDRLVLPAAQQALLMTCGPEVMMWYTLQTALRRRMNPELLYLSMERNMNCAIGFCGHCQFGSQFICRDGPVLSYDRVASVLKVHDL